ncbi:MAG TPA: hypothetical protein VFX25_40455, partial [Streptosporangiaceae bacterium]|nr:hypothetical protein [Streptosporangiaceae bacterium]
EDHMSSLTCPLCGLRYPARSLLDLHIREDHAQRDAKPAAPAAEAQDQAQDQHPAPPPPRLERTSWAETARRALSRMLGRAA